MASMPYGCLMHVLNVEDSAGNGCILLQPVCCLVDSLLVHAPQAHEGRSAAAIIRCLGAPAGSCLPLQL